MFEIFNVTYIIISTQKLCFDCVIIPVSYAAEMSQYLPLKIGENLKVLKAFMNLHFNNFVVYLPSHVFVLISSTVICVFVKNPLPMVLC